MNIVVNMGSL